MKLVEKTYMLVLLFVCSFFLLKKSSKPHSEIDEQTVFITEAIVFYISDRATL
jgi:hypothetical protein